VTPSDWPEARPIETPRLTLEPLSVEHAEEMASALDDPGLHEFIGGSPATADELRARYARQIVGHSPDGTEGWLNWVVRLRDTGDPAGTVQATVRPAGGLLSADVAWVVASPHQGRGIASEASGAMVEWLRARGVHRVVALVHPDHTASSAVARRLGLVATDDLVDGEVRWVSDRFGPESAGPDTGIVTPR
jgi:RimJ/RimL family protein N-acetyltransferase